MSEPDVDLIIAFRATKPTSLSKQQTREDARKSEKQYAKLIDTLTYAGLKAVGRRGESLGHLLVFVNCPLKLIDNLIKRERHSDFLSGLPIVEQRDHTLSPSERIRLIYTYISSTPSDGGLGISPDSPEWDLIESIFPLHNHQFNKSWSSSPQLEKTRDQFGDALAFYFDFLSSYTRFLIFPAILGLLSHFLLLPYSPLYSVLLTTWGLFFVEWWRVHERTLSLKFGTQGSFRVEKRRIQYQPGMSWWSRELRILGSIPIILLFGTILCTILTGIFIFEAFITQLYQGPCRQLIAFSPTLLFVILVPRFLAIYHSLAILLTNWENHAHRSSYTFSLTLKTFALGALVAYTGLALSAFVYVPFGEVVMRAVQRWLFSDGSRWTSANWVVDVLNGTMGMGSSGVSGVPPSSSPLPPSPSSSPFKGGLWDTDTMNARRKLNPTRLKDQMFAYTVTNQAVNTFVEVGLPFILRGIDKFRKKRKATTASLSSSSSPPPSSSSSSSSSSSAGGASGGSTNTASTTTSGGASGGIELPNSNSNSNSNLKKRVVFEDEKERGGMEERIFLDRVRSEAALPEYDLFVDYSEMVVQFGYVVLWSSIWPLAGVMALINNILELRSDAFKISNHHRRPIPITRTDTIGAWLDVLVFLAWLSSLINAALVYLFSPSTSSFSSFFGFDFNWGLVSEVIGDDSFNGGGGGDSFNSGESISGRLVNGSVINVTGSTMTTMKAGIVQDNTIITYPESKDLVIKSVLVALVASHLFLGLRCVVRHLVGRVWGGDGVRVRVREGVGLVREEGMENLVGKEGRENLVREEGRENLVREEGRRDVEDEKEKEKEKEDPMGFWEHDEGLEEIGRIVKEA